MTQSSVNSGTTVDLQGATVRYTWKALTNSTPIPGKFGLVETDVGGFENPKLILTGIIDAGSIATNTINQDLLRAFAKIQFDGSNTGTGGAIKLVVSAGVYGCKIDGVDAPSYTTQSTCEGASGTWTDTGILKDATSTNKYLWVIIEDFQFSLDTSVVGERKWRYSITCVETSTN